MRNRKALLAALKANGYTGDDSLESIKSFLETVDLDTGGESVDDIFARVDPPKPRLKIAVQADAEPVADDAPLPNKAAVINGTLGGIDAKGMRNIQARKRYDSEVARFQSSGRKNTYGGREPKFGSSDQAEKFGAGMRLMIAGPNNYREKATDIEIVGKTFYTNNISLGGSFVPDEFVADLISLREEYGVCRSNGMARVVPMKGDVAMFPRRTSGLTVYAPGEGGTITASTAGTDLVEVTAKTLGVICTASREWFNDSAINAGQFISDEIAYAFSQNDDNCFINGDGTSTYFGYTGILSALTTLSGTVANVAGLVAGTAPAAAYASVTITDYEKVKGRLPSYVKNPQWYFHKETFYSGPAAKILAQGGVTARETEDGVKPIFLGAPVNFVQAMPRNPTTNQVFGIYGEPSLGAYIGDVGGSMEIAMSDQRYFESGLIAVRGFERMGINVHSPGNASATASLRVPGPFVGIISASS